MTSTIKIARGLYEVLQPHVDAGTGTLDDMLETLLYEIPDEAMEVFMAIAAPVDVEVSSKVHSLITQIAEAFGMTPLGLTVLMHKVQEKTFEVASRYDTYIKQQAR